MKKVFQAVNEILVRKDFIGDNEEPPKGWFLTQQEAFAALAPAEKPAKIEAHEPKRRGRPRNEESVGTDKVVTNGDSADANH